MPFQGSIDSSSVLFSMRFITQQKQNAGSTSHSFNLIQLSSRSSSNSTQTLYVLCVNSAVSVMAFTKSTKKHT